MLSVARITALCLLLIVLALPASAQGFQLKLAPEGNQARFIAKEVFVGVELPFDPTGETRGVTGQIVIGEGDKIDTTKSRITVDLTTLKTDNSSRDAQLKRQSLETEKFPNAVLVPTNLLGLTGPIPLNGELTFSLIGQLTIHGTTKPTTWTVTATAKDGKYTGTAKTTITFEQFELTKPKSPRVLSIRDEIRLEYDFSMIRE